LQESAIGILLGRKLSDFYAFEKSETLAAETATVILIKALGGGWNRNAAQVAEVTEKPLEHDVCREVEPQNLARIQPACILIRAIKIRAGV
jgi:hypothetical protein